MALADLVRTYMRRGGFEIQVNVVSNDTLRAAQAHPEQYSDLVVRVAGYSDYFVKLSPSMQDEIIARTEHVL
jgi:pyruvate-formate lyase